uniref:flagellin lysine-N-methylase n=1 Tax=Acetatifactor sp. TaxID=1872090 RepID=UPI004055E33E
MVYNRLVNATSSIVAYILLTANKQLTKLRKNVEIAICEDDKGTDSKMRYLKPYYFDQFQCAADKCPDTCCAGWQIMIDEDTLDKYMQVKGDFGSRIANGVDWQEGCFLQHKKRCSMLNDNNLCDLVTAMGEEYLCETCDRYPRHVEEFEGLREWSLSLSCPIAAHMILECEEPLRMVEEEDDTQDPLEEEFEDFDFLLFTQLEEARKVLFQIVVDRTRTIEQRMVLLLQMAEEMQQCLEENRLYDMDELIASYEKAVSGINGQIYEQLCEQVRFQELKKQFEVFAQLERLREEWSEVIRETKETLFADEDRYLQIRRDFLAEYGEGGPLHKEWERYQENILIFFLYTYFCGAVYDDWIDTKVEMAVFSSLFIGEFVMCRWKLADNNINWDECVQMAYRYAREVEHSDDNLNLLEEWLQENPLWLRGTEH